MFFVFVLKEKTPKEKSFYEAFLAHTALSTSSSDMSRSDEYTDSDTAQELRNRMLRFEQRLEDHKTKLKRDSQKQEQKRRESQVSSSSGEWISFEKQENLKGQHSD